MTTPNNPNQNEFENTINARPITESEKNYRDGYYQGRAVENNLQSDRVVVEETGTSTGLFVGFLLAILAGLGIAAFFVFNNNEPTVAPVDTTVNERVEPENPDKETTIIERTIEKTQEVVPVPQAQPSNPTPTPTPSESKPVENSINIITQPETPKTEVNNTPEPTTSETTPEANNETTQDVEQNSTQPESTP